MNEDWDDMAAAEPLAGEELERMLARYARVRLDPGQAQVRRARAAVIEQAWRRRIATAATATPVRRAPFAGWNVRRLGASFAAAALAGLLLGTSAFAASRAGGPLYETRLAIEELSLPADAVSRVDAQIVAAQARLAEAVDASGRHDDGATVAALDAYDRVIDELMGASGPAAERALEAVTVHRDVLVRVAGIVPAAAGNGLERALDNSQRVIDRLTSTVATDDGTGTGTAGNENRDGNGDAGPGNGDAGAGNGNAGAGNGGAGPGNGNAGAGNGNGNGNAGAGKPAASSDPTTKPGHTKEPAATAKPDKTPRPRPTPDPGRKGEGNPQPGPSTGAR